MLLIRYCDGKVLLGVLIALGNQRIRVALRGADDAVEYRLISHRWVSEDCEVVSIGCAGQSDGTDGEPVLDSMISAGPQWRADRHVM